MTDSLDKYIDSRLKNSELTETSDNFTRLLMDKIKADYAVDVELKKRDRAANYIIVFFSSLMGMITFMAGYFYFSSKPAQTVQVSETWNTYLEKFSIFIQAISMKSAGIIILLLILSSLFLLADQVLLTPHKRNKGL